MVIEEITEEAHRFLGEILSLFITVYVILEEGDPVSPDVVAVSVSSSPWSHGMRVSGLCGRGLWQH